MVRPPVDVSPELEPPMLVVQVREHAGATSRTYAFTRHTLGVGRERPTLIVGHRASPEADIPIPGLREQRWISLVEDDGLLHAIHGGRLRREEGREDGPVAEGAVVELGDAEIRIVRFVPIAPPDFEASERDFLELVDDRADVGARLVYADVLEERGFTHRADFLRVQVRACMRERLEGDADASSRLHAKLAPAARWLRRIGAPAPLLRCPLTECPIRWSSSGKPTTCARCHRAVVVG